MSRVPQSNKIALTTTASQVCAALALGAATVISAAQTPSTKPVPAAPAAQTDSSQPHGELSERASAYYHYMLAHEYEDMANTYGRPEYATRAIEEYKLALDADPTSK